jgi:hypothetical protein
VTSKGKQITKIHKVKNVGMEIIANYVSMFIDLVEEGSMQVAIRIIWSPRKVGGNQKVIGYMENFESEEGSEKKGGSNFSYIDNLYIVQVKEGQQDGTPSNTSQTMNKTS